jgi:hypothetical protein
MTEVDMLKGDSIAEKMAPGAQNERRVFVATPCSSPKITDFTSDGCRRNALDARCRWCLRERCQWNWF